MVLLTWFFKKNSGLTAPLFIKIRASNYLLILKYFNRTVFSKEKFFFIQDLSVQTQASKSVLSIFNLYVDYVNDLAYMRTVTTLLSSFTERKKQLTGPNKQLRHTIHFTIGQLQCILAYHWSFVLYDVIFYYTL